MKNKKATAVAAITNEETAAKSLTESYKLVGQKMGEMLQATIAFGIKLEKWAVFLGESRGGAGGTANGEGLKTWLAKHCPEINYSTAINYKNLAAKATLLLGGGAFAQAALLGETSITDPAGEVIDVPAKVLDSRDELFKQADSRRKLEKVFAESLRDKPGRKPAKEAVYAEVRKTPVENAVATVWPIVKGILTHQGAWQAAIKFLPDDKLEEAMKTAEYFFEALKNEYANRAI